jgi:hypothetical protein
MKHRPDEQGSPPPFWGSRYSVGLVVMGAVAGYFLLTEHLTHVVGALPYLLLLACPLMHLFMHRERHPGHPHPGPRGEPTRCGKIDTGKPGDPS